LQTPTRGRMRIVPQSPITVAVEDGSGCTVAYGVIANLSESGACLWTDGPLEPGATLSLRVSFAHPPEVHEVDAVVVWADNVEGGVEAAARRFGVQWQDASSSCVLRIRHLSETPKRERTGSVPKLTVPLPEPG
jgi:hypothetical protein